MQFFRNMIEGSLLLILVLIGCLFCAYAFPESQYGLASWAQAIGSIAAIFAAIWLAHRDTRLKREDDRTVALLAAIEMSQSATELKLRIQAMLELIKFVRANGIHADGVEEIHQELTVLPCWEVSEVARLSPLPNHCALNLAKAQSAIYDGQLLLQSAIANPEGMANAESRKARIETLGILLLRATGDLERSIYEMNLALGAPERTTAMRRARV